MPAHVTVAVEGSTDVPVVRRILLAAGLGAGKVHGLVGKSGLDRQLRGYNSAARFAPWFVLRDMNGDAPCAGELVGRLLPAPAAGMCFRIAVSALETWLMADTEEMARFLRVPISAIPKAPESIADPKRALVALASRSRRRVIAQDMVPASGTSARVGPGYTARIVEYATEYWRPEVAAGRSPSLERCLRALRNRSVGGGLWSS